MVYIPSAEAFGFSLRLNEDAMREVLHSPETRDRLAEVAAATHESVAAQVLATASPESAANYVEALFHEDAYSDEYGFELGGPHSLGARPIAIVGIPAGRGSNPAAKPPLMVEAETHALSFAPGVASVGEREDIR